MVYYFATYDDLKNLDPDDRLAADELERRGEKVEPVVWDHEDERQSERIDWTKATACVIRSTWNYHLKFDQFQQWLARVNADCKLLNPLPLMVWNSRKTYLRDLEERGLSIVPTLFFDETVDVRALSRDQHWQRFVIKPVTGLATYGVKTVDGSIAGQLEQAQAHFDSLLKMGTVMVQPFLKSVGDEKLGERALVFIDGEYTHATRKTAFQPLKPAGGAGEIPLTAEPDELDLAKKTIESLDSRPLYARVDVIRTDDGKPVILELELVEPSLFFVFSKDAVQKFANALLRLTK